MNKRTNSQIGKYSKSKGGRGERRAVKVFKPVFPNAGRDLNDVYAKKGTDLIGCDPFRVQVKHWSKHVSVSKLHEVVVERDDLVPCLISMPTNGCEATITFYEDSFLTVCQAYGLFTIQQVNHKNHAPLTALKRTKAPKNGRIDLLLSMPSSDLKNTVTLFLSDFTNLLHSGKFKI